MCCVYCLFVLVLCLHVYLCLCPEKGAGEQVVISGILPVLSVCLRSRGALSLQTAKLVAELAKECQTFTQIHVIFSSLCMFHQIMN